MSKSLTNGTLSLRFMQNAHRRQNLQEVELKRAEIKDEGKWEMGQNIRDAWGIGVKQSSDSVVVHEPSYLPFLFSSEHKDTVTRTSKPRGRRMFNKHGLDVSQDQSPDQPGRDDVDDDDGVSGGKDPAATAEANDDPRSKRRKVQIHANPTPINERSLGKNSLGGFDILNTSDRTDRSFKSARDVIFSLSGVGTDLRSMKKSLEDDRPSTDHEQKPKQEERGVPSSTGFLKPVGVDESATRIPNLASSSKTKISKPPVSNIVDGARKKKRIRDPNEPETKKRKIKRSKLSRPPDEE